MIEVDDAQLDIAAKNLLNIFNDIRKECNAKPVKSGPIYLADGAKLSSIGLNSSDVNQIISLQIEKDRSENENDLLERLMPWISILGLSIAAMVIAYMVITSM